MRVDAVLRDMIQAVKQLLLALDNRLTAVENFGPEGIEGQVLTSNGPNEPPSYQAAQGGTTPAAHTHDAGDLVSGVIGEARLIGPYKQITELWPDRVKVGILMYQNPQIGTDIIDSGYDTVVAGPYTINGIVNVDGRLVIV